MTMDRKPSWTAELFDWIRTFAVLSAMLLVPRTVVAQPFLIPSGSMEPTLEVGDHILVSKYAYGWSRHSIPFSPPLGHGRLLAAQPERGDIVVFKRPNDGRTDIIKRLVGLPGDRIQVRGGVLLINDQPVRQDPLGVRTEEARGGSVAVEEISETLPNGRSYLTHSEGPRTLAANTGVYRVPAGCYFMMGDNRDNSVDSRFDPGLIRKGEAACAWNPELDQYLPAETGMGFVPAENLVGRAERVLFSWDRTSGLRWSRTFKSLSAPRA